LLVKSMRIVMQQEYARPRRLIQDLYLRFGSTNSIGSAY
jgi:hypothetical protein